MTYVSLALHAALFLSFSLTTFFKHRRYTAPNPYFVSIVSPSKAKKAARPARVRKKKKIAKKKPVVKKTPSKKKKDVPALKPALKPALTKPVESVEPVDENRVDDKIERLERLRRIRELAESKTGDSVRDIANAGQGAVLADVSDRYYGLVRLHLQERWTYLGKISKNLETEILIVLGPRGHVLSRRIVRGSGDPEFDDSVLRAIAKASPFPPPPEGVDREYQFRFKPEGSLD